jgi:DUF971 family protein
VASFWDTIKPSIPAPSVVDMEVSKDARELRLVWEDGLRTLVSARKLRQTCPCAGCVDEWTNKRTLDPALVKPDIAFTSVSQVGNYALSIAFTDRHSSGIYPWKQLRDTSSPAPV